MQSAKINAVQKALDDLAELQAQMETLKFHKSAAIPQDIRDTLDEIDAEFDPLIEALSEEIGELTKRIKQLKTEGSDDD